MSLHYFQQIYKNQLKKQLKGYLTELFLYVIKFRLLQFVFLILKMEKDFKIFTKLS